MNLISAFKNFQTQYSKDPQTTQKIRRYIETSSNKDAPVERGIAAVEDYIRSLRNRKIKHIMVYLDFVSWLKQNVSDSIQSNFPKDYVTSTRRIELIKYLQEPHSREDITEQLVVNERTLNSDFKALEDGIDVLGCTLKVKFRKYDREGRITVDGCEYHSSCNPVFLPLNMTELFLLTNIIPNYLTNTELCDSYKSILRKIYPQLTDYSLGLMKIEKSDILTRLGLEKNKYILLSAHREENIDTDENFYSLFNAINALCEKYNMPVIYSCHPRSKKKLEATGFKLDPRVIMHEPLGFIDYNNLQMNAYAVVSDSGTLPEESSFYASRNTPIAAVCIRTSTERPEALDKACFVLAGIDTTSLLQAVEVAVLNKVGCLPVNDYIDANVSDKVVKLIQSYTSVVNRMVWRKY